MYISRHLQIANYPKRTVTGKEQAIGPDTTYAGGSITDTLTVTGAEGDAYFLPSYEVKGSFAQSAETFLRTFIALCPGVPGSRCSPYIWRARGLVSDVYELHQFSPKETLHFRFGAPFRYSVKFYSKIIPPSADKAETLADTLRCDQSLEFAIKLVGVAITDQSGREIPRVKIISESGVEYRVLHSAETR